MPDCHEGIVNKTNISSIKHSYMFKSLEISNMFRLIRLHVGNTRQNITTVIAEYYV
jgi:hypothetical protein